MGRIGVAALLGSDDSQMAPRETLARHDPIGVRWLTLGAAALLIILMGALVWSTFRGQSAGATVNRTKEEEFPVAGQRRLINALRE